MSSLSAPIYICTEHILTNRKHIKAGTYMGNFENIKRINLKSCLQTMCITSRKKCLGIISSAFSTNIITSQNCHTYIWDDVWFPNANKRPLYMDISSNFTLPAWFTTNWVINSVTTWQPKLVPNFKYQKDSLDLCSIYAIIYLQRFLFWPFFPFHSEASD